VILILFGGQIHTGVLLRYILDPVLLLFPLLTIQALVNHVCCTFSVEKTILLQYSLKVCSLRDTYFMVLYDHENLRVNEYRLAGMNQLLVRDSQGCHYGRLSP
jgi:hypothetical protein